MLAQYMPSLSVRPSVRQFVCLSVTSRCSTKMAKCRSAGRYDSLSFLVQKAEIDESGGGYMICPVKTSNCDTMTVQAPHPPSAQPSFVPRKHTTSQTQRNFRQQTTPRCAIHNEYMRVFIVEQNLVGISAVMLVVFHRRFGAG